MAVFNLAEDLGVQQPEGYYERKQIEFETGKMLWRRTDFNDELITVQFIANYRLLGHLSVSEDNHRSERKGKSAVAFAYEQGAIVAVNSETAKIDRLAEYYPVSPAKAAHALVKYCAEHGKLSHNE